MEILHLMNGKKKYELNRFKMEIILLRINILKFSAKVLFIGIVFHSCKTTNHNESWFVQKVIPEKSSTIIHIHDSIYNVYSIRKPGDDTMFLMSYGTVKYLATQSNKTLIFNDSIRFQPSIKLDHKASFNNTLNDSMDIILNITLFDPRFFVINLMKGKDTLSVYTSRARMGINKFRIINNMYDSFFVEYQYLYKKNKNYQYSDFIDLTNNGTNNEININMRSEYRGIFRYPNDLNLDGDTAELHFRDLRFYDSTYLIYTSKSQHYIQRKYFIRNN